jgi:signal transduction histidine kinase
LTANRPQPASLVRRLILLAGGWSLVALVITGIVLTVQFERVSLGRVQQRLDDIILNLETLTEVIPGTGDLQAPTLSDARFSRAYSGNYWQIAELDGTGGLRPVVVTPSLLDTYIVEPRGGAAPLLRNAGKAYYYDAPGPEGKTLRVAALLLKSMTGHPEPVVFMAALDRSQEDHDTKYFAATTAAALILLGMGILLGVYIQVRVGLRPLFAMRREIAEVRKGKADVLVRSYPAELAPLAEEMNALVAHNQEVVERQRTHVGNLAHALKTPISVMLAEADSQPDNPLTDVVRRQADAMHDHVNRHLRRARAATRTESQRERTQVAPVLDELARTLNRIFQDKNDGAGLQVDWDADDDLCFQGERQDFQEIVGNLMENACKWARRKVRVIAAPSGPGLLTITVEDDGPGLPADQREQALKRGARLDEATPGTGLGLSIVDELARAYGGGISLEDSALGGLRAALTLPRAEV